MYTSRNFKTKKALKEAVTAGQQISVYQPNGDLFGVEPPLNGKVTLEGPHYPLPHKWYAQATLVNGIITKVR
jgi:hypothetical protein